MEPRVSFAGSLTLPDICLERRQTEQDPGCGLTKRNPREPCPLCRWRGVEVGVLKETGSKGDDFIFVVGVG